MYLTAPQSYVKIFGSFSKMKCHVLFFYYIGVVEKIYNLPKGKYKTICCCMWATGRMKPFRSLTWLISFFFCLFILFFYTFKITSCFWTPKETNLYPEKSFTIYILCLFSSVLVFHLLLPSKLRN